MTDKPKPKTTTVSIDTGGKSGKPGTVKTARQPLTDAEPPAKDAAKD